MPFIELGRRSRRFCRGLASPLTDRAKFDQWVARSDSDRFRGLVVCRTDDGQMVGVVNLSEIVGGIFRSAYMGYHVFAPYARQGYIDHSDSMGAAARFGRGDVQWMTAGGGVVHAAMFPLLDRDGPNTVELFQIWLNLPPEDKLVEPHFSMLWDTEVPRLTETRGGEVEVEVTVIAGALGDLRPPAPPPRSWAARPDTDVAIWHLRLAPGGRWVLPAAAGADTVRTLYVFDGAGLRVGAHDLSPSTGAVVRCDRPVEVTAPGGVEVLVLQGRPIGAPVAQYGPFVMNTEDEIRAAMRDYQRTEFGGWPWPADDPVHGRDPARFARHADGREERAPASTVS